jgi:hypothetical protein
MTLSELKPRGYRLSDVPPDFQGMPINDWLRAMVTSRCNQFLESPKAKAWHEFAAEQRWWKRGIH